jgi:predicted Holliday junction resolvase-like endonuclease
MIQFLLIVIAILVAACAVLIITVKYQRNRADLAQAEAASLHEAFWDAARKAERLQAALGKQAEAEVQADEERKELAGTADGDLVRRANNLFGGGVPVKPGTGSAGSD